MQTMTARDAKTHFGLFLDTMQREPVIVTKNSRPVGIMISIEDAADSLIPELHLQKEPGYDEWLQAKIDLARAKIKSGAKPLLGHDHDDVMDRVLTRLQAKAARQAVAR